MPNKQTVITGSSIAAGIATYLYGVLADGRIDGADLRSAGLLVLLASLVPAWHRAMRSTPACAYELGYRDGKQDGHAEGRRVARPVVIPAQSCECGHRLGLVQPSAQE